MPDAAPAHGRLPSTALRLVQLPRSRTVLGILPPGDDFQPRFVSGNDHRPVGLDGEPTPVDLDTLRA